MVVDERTVLVENRVDIVELTLLLGAGLVCKTTEFVVILIIRVAA